MFYNVFNVLKIYFKMLINGVGTIFINVYYALYINIFFMMIIEPSLIIVWF